jgi:hypothetical protein
MHGMGQLGGILLCYGVRPSLRREVSFPGAYYQCYRLLVVFPIRLIQGSTAVAAVFLIRRDAKVLLAL